MVVTRGASWLLEEVVEGENRSDGFRYDLKAKEPVRICGQMPDDFASVVPFWEPSASFQFVEDRRCNDDVSHDDDVERGGDEPDQAHEAEHSFLLVFPPRSLQFFESFAVAPVSQGRRSADAEQPVADVVERHHDAEQHPESNNEHRCTDEGEHSCHQRRLDAIHAVFHVGKAVAVEDVRREGHESEDREQSNAGSDHGRRSASEHLELRAPGFERDREVDHERHAQGDDEQQSNRGRDHLAGASHPGHAAGKRPGPDLGRLGGSVVVHDASQRQDDATSSEQRG